jgi:hypothetical protein
VNKKRRREDTELDRFMEAPIKELQALEYVNTPLAWWREKGERQYPLLAPLAFTLLSMPGMSAECERIFSQAKRMVTDERFNLKADVIEAEQCLKSWLINGVVNGSEAWQLMEEVQHQVEVAEAIDRQRQLGAVAEPSVSKGNGEFNRLHLHYRY